MSDHKTPRQYDAGDLHDAYSLGHESIEWLTVLLGQIRTEFKEVQARLEEKGIHEAHFHTLGKLVDLTEFMAEERTHALGVLTKKYEHEYWGATKWSMPPHGTTITTDSAQANALHLIGYCSQPHWLTYQCINSLPKVVGYGVTCFVHSMTTVMPVCALTLKKVHSSAWRAVLKVATSWLFTCSA